MTTLVVAVVAAALLWLQGRYYRDELARWSSQQRRLPPAAPPPPPPAAPAVQEIKQSLDVTVRRLEDQGRALQDLDRELQSAKEKSDRDSFLVHYLDCILDSMTSGVMVFDVLSRFTLLNREAEGILKKPGEELLGTMLVQYPNLFGLLGLINAVRSNRPLLSRSAQQLESKIEDFHGSTIPLGVSINGLLDDDGNVMGYVVICKDLTERKRMIANLERAEKLSALGTMASGVAHNFNNILAAVLGRVQLLLRYPDRVKLVEGLKIIEKSALDGAATVKRLQDFARKRCVKEDFSAVDLNEVVQDVVSFTRVKWDDASLAVRYDVATELQASSPVFGSASELREVLINLVLNAIDAMPNGGRLCIRTEGDDQVARMVVSDTGTGIPEEIKRRIFDPFFTTKGVRGTGLGLSESYGIVKRHGGVICCESQLGAGTTFTVELPLRPQASAREERQESPFARKLSVLVVDDDAAQAELLCDLLATEEHRVATAGGAAEAQGVLAREAFDLVIVDLGLPDPADDPWSIVVHVRERLPQARVLAVAEPGGEASEDRLREGGVDLQLVRPLRFETVLRALDKLFGAP